MPTHFNEKTYEGRFQKFLELTNIRHLLHTDSQISACKKGVDSGKDTSYNSASIVAACVHPNTKQIIPVYGRMASFLPANIPICSGMLLTTPTLFNVISWQWINQTYNAVFNYSNSAKSKNDAIAQSAILKAYSGSVFVSVGLAVGLTQWVKKASLPKTLKPMLQTIVPYAATASAGAANVVLMRSKELQTGIPVTTIDGMYLGQSKIAAKKALYETAISRAVLPIPMLLAPPPFIALCSKLHYFQSSYLRKKMMELTFLALAITFGLPAALALYPQHTYISINELEKEFACNTNDNDIVMYNKGV